MFKFSFNSILLESGKLKLHPDDVGHIFGSELLVYRIPTFKAKKIPVQVNRLLEADHDAVLGRELLHRVFGVPDGPVVMAGDKADAEQELTADKKEQTLRHFPEMHFSSGSISTLAHEIF